MVRYATIPSKAQFEKDSSPWFSIRSWDLTLGQIDRLLESYPGLPQASQPDALYYLYLACRFWLKKINLDSKNTAPAGFTDPKNSLPTAPKVSGNLDRRQPIVALISIVEETLMKSHGCEDPAALLDLLADAYECTNHELATDQAWNDKYAGKTDVLSVYMTTDGMRRRYKLRFRKNLAHRWADSRDTQGGYALFDTTGNEESEINDGMSHFVMAKNGRIYSGFEKEQRHRKTMDLVWFKHSSLVGGISAASAGRMRVEAGAVKHVINDSGHYQPQAKHMINLLQRLAIYGQTMAQITVERISDQKTFPALDMLRQVNAWPDGKVGH